MINYLWAIIVDNGAELRPRCILHNKVSLTRVQEKTGDINNTKACTNNFENCY